ncbi:MAG: MarR family transcriptional regulator, partial [Nitrosomonas sp.]|nr:MarR family transcriptional regulator [Nitrosomonas sp.]
RAALARAALNVLYCQPVVNAKQLENALKITTPTANSLIKALQEKNLLTEMTGQQRGRSYVFDRYLRLFLS